MASFLINKLILALNKSLLDLSRAQVEQKFITFFLFHVIGPFEPFAL